MPLRGRAADQEKGNVDRRKALTALISANCIGIMMMAMTPLVVGSVVDAFAVREGTAGIITALEFGTMAIASLMLATRFDRLNARRLALASIAVVVDGNAASIWAVYGGDWVLFIMIRGLVGLGEGALLAASNGMAARTRDPERTFSYLAGWEVMISLFGIAGITVLIETMGPSGTYWALAFISLVFAPFLVWFPSKDAEPSSQESHAKSGLRFERATVVILAAYSAFQLGLSIIWPFVERIGDSLGFSASAVGAVLFVALASSVLGPVLCGILGTRVGRVFPIVIATSIQIVSILIMVYSKSFTWYAGQMVVAGIAFLYLVPLMNGLLAFHDPTGRANAGAAGLTTIATALGPLVGGFTLNAGGSYRLLGWFAVSMYVVMLTLILRHARAADLSLGTDLVHSGSRGS